MRASSGRRIDVLLPALARPRPSHATRDGGSYQIVAADRDTTTTPRAITT